ncbi:MAG: hypothetical protein KIS86_04655 [Devosia sp.]|nr:hypothetical protein [Devosia sp.]
MTGTFADYLVQDARLVILRALADQVDGRLNETILTAALASFGHNRSRDWVRQQLRHLADVGAVAITEAGSIMIGELTRLGYDHVGRRVVIEGVARPSPGK